MTPNALISSLAISAILTKTTERSTTKKASSGSQTIRRNHQKIILTLSIWRFRRRKEPTSIFFLMR